MLLGRQEGHPRYVVQGWGHGSSAIVAQGVACENEVLETGVRINVLCQCCCAGCAQALALQIKSLQRAVACNDNYAFSSFHPVCGPPWRCIVHVFYFSLVRQHLRCKASGVTTTPSA